MARPSFANLGICSAYLRAPLIKLLVAYESSTQYRSRFDFYGIGERGVRRNIGKEIHKAIARALRSLSRLVAVFGNKSLPEDDLHFGRVARVKDYHRGFRYLIWRHQRCF